MQSNVAVLIFLFSAAAFCDDTLDLGLRSERTKRFKEDEESSTLITCDGGHFTATCPSGTAINITLAEYGRNSTENICAKTGMGKTEFCRSPETFNRIREFCKLKDFCQMDVNADNLGRPVTPGGDGCFETSKYLKLVYKCSADCDPPQFRYNAEVVGNKYHVGSSVTVHCREGYERVDRMTGGVKKTCEEGRGWVGPTLLCQDVNECENPSTNRCHRFADCQNTRGSYSCTCIDGYQGDGITCTADSWFMNDGWSTEESTNTGNSQQDDWDQALIEVHDERVCDKRIIKGRQGVLKSPNNPGTYPSKASCVWIIAVPPGLVVRIRFMKFDIEREQTNEGCSHDNVTMYDGLNRDPKWWLGTYCGDAIPPVITSQSNKIRVEFRSDDNAEFSGFEARFYAVDLNSACLNFPAASYIGLTVVNGTRNSTTQPRKTLTLGCQAGYMVTSQSLVRTCRDDGTWDDSSNPCSPVSCGLPYLPIDAEGLYVDAETSRFRYGELPVRYKCRTGYRIHVDHGSDAIIVCDRKGRWSNEKHRVLPWCEKITCVCQHDVTCAPNEGDPIPHKALQWTVRDHEGTVISQPVGQTLAYGSEIKYSCAKGYSLAGDEMRLCTENGWSGRRTTCEEVGVGKLSNKHIAIIASAASGFIILVIAIALIICCCRDHQKKSKKRKQIKERRMRAARDNQGFVLNMAVAGNDDFLYGNTVDRRGRNKGFAGRHNDIRKYQARQHVLPTSGVPPSMPDNYYNGEIRPTTNRTFRPQDGGQANAPIRNGNNLRSSSSTKLNSPGNAPPPGYMDPPPSYDTMVREGYSNKSVTERSRNRKR